MYQLLALVSLIVTVRRERKKESQIIDFGDEGTLRDPNPSQYRWEN